MENREGQLARLLVGDIFHATCANGASLICLAAVVTRDRIVARRITSQDRFEFNRATGSSVGGKSQCSIDSVAPLPVPVFNVMLGLDRKMRLQRDPEKFKLDRDEKDALRFVDTYYAGNPLL